MIAVVGLVGPVVVASILAHSSADTLVARSFRDATRDRHDACGLSVIPGCYEFWEFTGFVRRFARIVR